MLRPPVAQERIEPEKDGLIAITLKRAYADGTVAVVMDPLSLLCRLAMSVPPPRYHTVKYAGVLACASPLRSRIAPVPAAQVAPPIDPAPVDAGEHPAARRRSTYWPARHAAGQNGRSHGSFEIVFALCSSANDSASVGTASIKTAEFAARPNSPIHPASACSPTSTVEARSDRLAMMPAMRAASRPTP
jgi:hypothetical protein